MRESDSKREEIDRKRGKRQQELSLLHFERWERETARKRGEREAKIE